MFVARVTASIVIKAPIEQVFQYFDDPRHEEEWAAAPNVRLIEVREQRRLPNGGWYERLVIEAAGGRLEVRSEDLEYVPPTLIRARTSHAPQAFVDTTKRFLPVPGGTRVTYEVDYPMRLLDTLVRQYRLLAGQRWQRQSLQRAKASIEGTPPPPRPHLFASAEVLLALGIALVAGFASNAALEAAFGRALVPVLIAGTTVVLGVYLLTLELSSLLLRKRTWFRLSRPR